MPVFVFAGGADRVHPLSTTRDSFGQLGEAGYRIEWHVEPELGHQAESLNEQRYIAYWAARASLGTRKAFDPSAVDTLRRLLVSGRREASKPRAPSPRTWLNNNIRNAHNKQQRPQTSPGRVQRDGGLPHTHAKSLSARAYGEGDDAFQRMHPLMREPEWRMRPQSSNPTRRSPRRGQPVWDIKPLGGLGPPQLLDQLEAARHGIHPSKAAARERPATAQATMQHQPSPRRSRPATAKAAGSAAAGGATTVTTVTDI